MRHHLNARVGMRRDPLPEREFVFQRTVPCGAISGLTSKKQKQLRAAIAGDRETHCIATAINGKTGATTGVTQITIFGQFFLRRLDTLMARGRTMSVPAATQW